MQILGVIISMFLRGDLSAMDPVNLISMFDKYIMNIL